MTNRTTQQLREWDHAHVWHPFTPMQAHRAEDTPIIVEGEGFHLTDTEGNRYLDGTSSLWCNVHGHRVPEIDAAIKTQVDTLSHSTMLGLSHPTSIELARKLATETPGDLNQVFYSDSGSTAVEVALKMAYQYHHQTTPAAPQRDRFLCVGGAYHGDTIGSVSLGGIDLFHKVYGKLLFETISVPSPVGLWSPEGYTGEEWVDHCLAETERVVREQHDRLIAVVIEPLVQGAAGILVHPEGYLKKLREWTKEYGVLLIADEVAVGFGRTGTLFACEQENVEPDFLCLAKGITGGYLPLAATVTTDEIAAAFLGDPAEGRTFFHGHTYTGNPLGCAAALASWKLFEENNILQQVKDNTEHLTERLASLADHPHVAEVRQKGIMVGIELVQSRAPLTPFASERRTGHRVTLAARKRGAIMRPLGDVIVLMPAPAMPTALVDQLCDVAFESINEAMK